MAFKQLDCWLVSGACVALGEQVICHLPKKLGSCVTPNESATSHWPCTQPRALRSCQLASWANQEEHSMISVMRIGRMYKCTRIMMKMMKTQVDGIHHQVCFAWPPSHTGSQAPSFEWTKHGRQLNAEPPSSKTVPCIHLLSNSTTRY